MKSILNQKMIFLKYHQHLNLKREKKNGCLIHYEFLVNSTRSSDTFFNYAGFDLKLSHVVKQIFFSSFSHRKSSKFVVPYFLVTPGSAPRDNDELRKIRNRHQYNCSVEPKDHSFLFEGILISKTQTTMFELTQIVKQYYNDMSTILNIENNYCYHYDKTI